MVVTAHVTCAQVLDTLRSSGLTYTINETPYSVYLTVRKKYTKDYSPSQLSNDLRKDGGDKASIDILAQLLQEEISNHNVTKFELSQREDELRMSCESNNQNVEESRKQHFRQISTIAQLTADLEKEVDEHEQSEHELRKLEAIVDTLKKELDDVTKQKESVAEENIVLREKLEDAEQEIENSHKVAQSQSEKLLQYEFKHAELATLDTAVLKSKVADLETKIAGKERIISLLNNQAKLSLTEITKLRQNRSISDSPDTTKITPVPTSMSLQLKTPLGISQLGTHNSCKLTDTNIRKTEATLSNVDQNENTQPDIDPHTEDSVPLVDNLSPGSCTDPEKYCQNCKSKVTDLMDMDVQLPSPIYFYNFVNNCPSPWLHYGYCTPCLEVARFTNSADIINHITHCEVLVGECWDGEHENHIEHYKLTESESTLDL